MSATWRLMEKLQGLRDRYRVPPPPEPLAPPGIPRLSEPLAQTTGTPSTEPTTLGGKWLQPGLQQAKSDALQYLLQREQAEQKQPRPQTFADTVRQMRSIFGAKPAMRQPGESEMDYNIRRSIESAGRMAEGMSGGIFHAQNQMVPGILKPRGTPRSVNEMGTWFTSDPDIARELYGRHVTEYETPVGNLLEAHTPDFDAFFGQNLPLIEQHFGKEAASVLKQTPPNSARLRELRALQRRDELGLKDAGELQRLEQSHQVARAAQTNPAYVQAFKQMLEDAGYTGVRWPESTIDAPSTGRHDVYLMFNKEPIVPKKR